MSREEINQLIEDLIAIRDYYRDTLTRKERDTIADACNLIEHNIDALITDTYTVKVEWI